MFVFMTFDDGRSDAITASEIMKDNNLRGTFFITTGFVDGTFQTSDFGNGRKPITIKELSTMKDNGMEIASHGDRHIMDFSDFVISFNKIKTWGLNNYSRIGFSVPNSHYSKDEADLFIKQSRDMLMYFRVGRNKKCYSFINKIRYFLYRFFKIQSAFSRFNKNNILDVRSFDSQFLSTIVVKKYTNPKSILKFIDKYNKPNSAIILMFHSIVDKPNDPWEWSNKNFALFCKELSLLQNKKTIICKTLGEHINDTNK